MATNVVTSCQNFHHVFHFQDGCTPLMMAVKRDHLDVVKILVENGHADVNITENVSFFFIAVSMSKTTLGC